MAADRKIKLLNIILKKIIKVEQFASTIDENEEIDRDDIEHFLEKLESEWNEFKVHETDTYSMPAAIDIHDKIESSYDKARIILKRALRKYLPQTQPLSAHDQSFNDDIKESHRDFIQQMSRLNKATAERHTDAKLPSMNIPNFSGDYCEWPSFQNLFETAIHNRSSLSNATKLQYLKNFLKGKAESSLQNVQITNENYEPAWERIKSKFSKPKFIANSFIKTFMDQPSCPNLSAAGLRKMDDISEQSIRGLDNIGSEAKGRDPWLIFIILSRLDIDTRQQWSLETAGNEFPTFDELLSFLDKRCDALESGQSFAGGHSKNVRSHATMSMEGACLRCGDIDHKLHACPNFKTMAITDRRKFVNDNSLCFNCLYPSHLVFQCKQKFSCKVCRKRHNSLLHLPDEPKKENPISKVNAMHSQHQDDSHPVSADIIDSSVIDQKTEEINSLSIQGKSVFKSLLPTLVVNVRDASGAFQACRVLLDSASESSFVTEACVKRLCLPRSAAKYYVSGLSAAGAGTTRGSVLLEIYSRHDAKTSMNLNALILPKLTSNLPSSKFDVLEWRYIKGLKLADSNFNKSLPIDILIGSEEFFEILCSGRVTGPSGFPIAQETKFGWIIAGKLPIHENTLHAFQTSVSLDIDQTLRKFWELEEIPSLSKHTAEETACESHYIENTRRDTDGRYIVRLPFKTQSNQLGKSLPGAVSRLFAMERKFQRNPKLKEEYSKFMREYLLLNHMEPIPMSEIQRDDDRCYYLPHHSVIKDSSTTTRLRVVFDASCKTSSGVSLNDKLMVGATVQRTMFSTIIKFRCHNIVFAADIEKMYRQVLISKDDTNFQRIVWREDANVPIVHYRLLTVTYGLASAPYLAIRSLFQLADDYKDQYPLASNIIRDDFYVDDLMSGSNDINDAMKLVQELTTILKSGGFQLRKWKSNKPELLSSFLPEDLELSPLALDDDPRTVNVLGLEWIPEMDSFVFKVQETSIQIPTKRSILSDSSRIFDPLGWLSPATVKLKIIFQKLWLLKLGWDDAIPSDIANEWLALRRDLNSLSCLKIPRCIIVHRTSLELHGFSDASELAYSAAVYMRSSNSGDEASVNLIASKTKVAPIKQITIPRLELCGAVLLSRLLVSVREALGMPDIGLFAWTDSTIVLQWLSSHPRTWKTFVGNRTAEILTNLDRNQWNHISTNCNPADCASRGISSSELLTHALWWNGPPWLSNPRNCWPRFNEGRLHPAAPERRIQECCISLLTNTFNPDLPMFHNISKWSKLIRVISFCSRFVYNARVKAENRKTGCLTTAELQSAEKSCIKSIQLQSYAEELHSIQLGKPISSRSNLLSLNPFMDAEGVLRVGGRTDNSSLPFSARHPIIIPPNSAITKLIIQDIHLRHLHVGPSLMISLLRQRFWIINCRVLVRKCVRQCVTCFRLKAKVATQIMGQLPPCRVTATTRPFIHTGVDYAGPIQLKSIHGRQQKHFKGYIAVFVCMATKALHLDILSDLSSEAFIACLRRFISRRGIPSIIFSDNGTNFVGAYKEIKELRNLLCCQKFQKSVSEKLSTHGIQWQFQPP